MWLDEDSHYTPEGTSDYGVHDNFSGAVGARDEHVIGATTVEEKPGDPEDESARNDVRLVVRPEFVCLIHQPLFKRHMVVLVHVVHNFAILLRLFQ